MKKKSKFLTQLSIFLSIIFSLHFLFIDQFLKQDLVFELIVSYAFNLVFGFLYYFIILNKSKSDNFGFIFMGLSVLKIIAFIVLIKPFLEINGEISRTSFLLFLIPYATTLVFEIKSAIKFLNN